MRGGFTPPNSLEQLVALEEFAARKNRELTDQEEADFLAWHTDFYSEMLEAAA